MSGDGCDSECSVEQGYTCPQLPSGTSSCSLIVNLAIVRTVLEQQGNSIKVQLFLNRKVLFAEFGDDDVAFSFSGLEESERETKVTHKNGISDSVAEIVIEPKKSFGNNEVVILLLI